MAQSLFRALVEREESYHGATNLRHWWNKKRLSTLEFSQAKSIYSAHKGAVLWLDLDHAESRYLLACGADASIAAYDTAHPSTPDNEHEALFTLTKRSEGAHKSSISCVAWYPVDAGLFVSGGRDGDVKVWDANALATACTFGIEAAIHATAMSPLATSHCLVAVGSEQTDVVLCDILSGGFTHRLSGHRGLVWALAWSASCEWELVTGDRGGQMRLWDVRKAVGALHVFDVQNTSTNATTRNGGGLDCLGGGGFQAPTNVANATAQATTNRFAQAHSQGITGIVPTPDGMYWISAGNDDSIRLWETSSYRHMLVNYRNAFNRASKPRQIAVSDDGGYVFHPSGSAMQVFDTHSGRQAAVLTGGHFESINACVWNPVTEELYSGAGDRAITVWTPRLLAQPQGGSGGGGGGGDDDDNQDAWSDSD